MNINHLPECVLPFGMGSWQEMEQGQVRDVVIYWLGGATMIPPSPSNKRLRKMHGIC